MRDDELTILGPDPRMGTPVPDSQLVPRVADLDQRQDARIALLNPKGATE
ncbi:hypothetical protein ACIBCO_35975 [Streptomyces violascens]